MDALATIHKVKKVYIPKVQCLQLSAELENLSGVLQNTPERFLGHAGSLLGHESNRDSSLDVTGI